MLQHYNEDVDLDLVNDYLQLLRFRCQDAASRSRGQRSPHSEPALGPQFDTFSRVDASTHGAARPLARFHVDHDEAHKVSGHELDYLAYRGPLTGDFEVNCEVATRPGAFSELMVQGTATQPVDDGKRISIGGFAKGNRQFEITPPLEEIESLSHLRVVVRDGLARHFFNGRLIHESTVDTASTPWVALRSWRRTNSEIRNLHLIGSPTIADSIDLLADGSLGGWASYFDPDFSDGLGSWNTKVDDDQTINLISDDPSGATGSYDEDLIRYVRPISWDAQIRYEFYFQPGAIEVHPALGRSVFFISAEGIRLHRLTDGMYEQSALRPDNSSELGQSEPDSLVKPELRAGWNEAELQLTGDTLNLKLNDQPIARAKLTRDQSRVFGLFRYRDQTRAVVRNLRLTGDWPKTIPSIDKQVLASKVAAELDRSAVNLPHRFVHDFGQGVPSELFDFEGDQTSVSLMSDGVRMGRSEMGGVSGMRLSAMIDGDFDIVAGYKDLEISTGDPTWHCGVGLAFNLDNPTRDRCAINRRRDRMHGHHYIGFGHKEINAGGKTSWTGGENVVDESTSGKLRLVRRGTKVYGLHAIGDSPSFRIVKMIEVPPGRIAVNGLRLVTDIGKGLHTHVTWTALEIRAEEVDLLQVADEGQTLARLNELGQRQASQLIDLTQQSLGDAGIFTSGSAEVTADQNGVTVNAQGADSPNRFALMKSVSLDSEFDVQADFQILRLDRGFQGQPSSEVVLQVRLQDEGDFDPESEGLQIYEATIILRHKENGRLDLSPRVVGRGRGGKTIYLPIRSIPVKMPDQYRIAQYDRTLYFMYSEQGSPESTIIATYPLERPLRASTVNLWTIASREGRVATTCWKQLHIHGENSQELRFFRPLPIQPSQR